MKCPSCGTESDGRFCPECGAPLADAQCARCASPLLAGARFCTNCGATARSGIGGTTGWYVAAGILVVMIGLVWVLTSRDRSGGDAATVQNGAAMQAAASNAPDAATGSAGASSGAPVSGSPPALTGTPR